MKHAIATIALLLSLHIASAQGVLFGIQNQNYQPGDHVRMTVRTWGFVNMTVFQFALLCDTSALKIDSVTRPGTLPEYGPENFGWKEISQGNIILPGELRTIWTDVIGRTLEDGSEVFTLHLTARAAGSLSADVQNFPQGLVFEACVYPVTFVPIDVVFYDEVTQTTEGQIVAAPTAYPNPCNGTFQVIGYSGRVEVYNSAGRMVYQGDTSQPITLPGAGAYVLRCGRKTQIIISR